MEEEEPLGEEEVGMKEEEEYDYFGETPEYEPTYAEGLPPPISEERCEEEPEKRPNRKPGSFWKRPATKVYPDTFSFFVNSYQPMIDYLDLKDSGLSVNSKDIHLPLSEERCLRKFSSTKPFKWYTNTDIDRYIAKGEKIRTQIRQNDAAGASNVLRRTHTNWSMTKKYVQLVKNSYVTDPRKIATASDTINSPVIPRISAALSPLSASGVQKYLLIPLARDYNPYSTMVDVATAHQIDHETMMSARRRRMKDIDGQIGSSINHMTATIDLMNRPTYGEEIDIPISSAGDLLFNNRSRREEEMDHMMDQVDSITNADSERNVSRRMYANELARIQNERLSRKPAKSRVIYVDNPVDTDLDFLRTRRTVSPMVVDLDTPRYRRPKEDTVSDVQDRVYQRANQLTGTTSEMRRINDRSKYLNVMGPRTTLDIVPVGYTKTADNINHLARDFATKGKAVKRFEVDQELEELSDLIYNTKANMLRKTYSTDPVKVREPADPLASNSVRVREAQGRASTRNALLHGY